MPDVPQVKCKDCGFLSLRNEFTGQLDEASGPYRVSGEPPAWRKPSISSGGLGANRSGGLDFPYRTTPICFVMEFDLLAEHLKTGPDYGQMDVSGELAKEIISKERHCAAFTKWHQGFTPKEHREMLDRQWRIKHEDDVREAVWKREDARDKTQADDHSDLMKTMKSQHRWQLFWFGVAVVVATVAGSMIQAGWITKPW